MANKIFTLSILILVVVLAASGLTRAKGADDQGEAENPFIEAGACLDRFQAGGHPAVVECLLPLAESGDPYGQFYLGESYRTGSGVPEDHAQAMAWYRKAAAQGETTSMKRLGIYYFEGEHVAKDLHKARHWFQQAAKKGEPYSQNMLGDIHRLGLGAPRDMEAAVQWYRKASDGGDENAPYSLGEMYRDGNGVPRDMEQAAQWFYQSAWNGGFAARYEMATMYRDGVGVTKDLVQAYAWFEVAASDYVKSAEYRSIMADLAESMTPNQIEQAKKRAYELYVELDPTWREALEKNKQE